ncbi:hypothetical protein Tco_0703458 [Tanacetum coccineum]|uniref:Uncharacterized protein n=1 Tax=Tanacetum coccineum TaxID=301880 RepID=A0ABQ4Y0S2_9ASTR
MRRSKRVLETHERLVTEKPTSDEGSDESDDEQEGRLTRRRPSGVVIRDTPKVSMKKTSDQSQKLKGIEMLSDHNLRGSSDGAGNLHQRFTDEPEGKSKGSIERRTVKFPVTMQEYRIRNEAAKSEKEDEEENGDEAKLIKTAKGVLQAGALGSVTQNEKRALPPSTSSLSLSSDYDNQFLNLSFEVSLVDPPPDSKMEKKKRKRKDVEPLNKSSTSKELSKCKTLPKTSKTGKSVTTEESVEELVQEVAMEVEEPIQDDVVNDVDQPHDDADPKKDNSTWFTQPTRPETHDPEWNKDKNFDDGLEQTWFNDLVNAEKDSLTFDELMATLIDFTKFAMNRLKLDKITKADLVGPV